METMFKNLAFMLLTPECYNQYFVNLNFLHGECMKATVSKAVGLLIIIGSFTVKVPQILKIIGNKSSEGISLSGTALELAAMTSVASYCYLKEFPFSSWGDGLFAAIQTVAVVALILFYRSQHREMFFFISVYTTFVVMTTIRWIPLTALWIAQFFNMPIIMLGKGVQAMSNYKNQSTGQLSAMTLWMQFGGCLARIFTSIQETGDMMIILMYVLATTLNGFVLFQLYYYASTAIKKKKE